MDSGAVSEKVLPRVPLRHGEGDKDHLTRLAALSLGAYAVGRKTWEPVRWP